MLFDIAVEEVVKNTLHTGIELTAYADDIVLLSQSENDLQYMADALVDESKQTGLTIK